MTDKEKIEVLKKALEFYRDGFKMITHPWVNGISWEPSDTLLEDCGNNAVEALELTTENEHDK